MSSRSRQFGVASSLVVFISLVAYLWTWRTSSSRLASTSKSSEAFRASHVNVWAELSSSEASDIYAFLYKDYPELNLTDTPRTGNENHINFIETLTGEYMDRYGYERLTAGDAGITQEMLAQAGVRSDEARERSWRDLEHDNFRDYVLRRGRADYLAQLAARLVQQAAQPGRNKIVTLDELDPAAFEVSD